MKRSRVIRLAFIIVFVCFLLSTFVSLWSLRLMAKQNMRELSKALAARIYDTIGGELSEHVMVARTMASDRFLIETLDQEEQADEHQIIQRMTEYLSGIRENLEYEAVFVVSSRSKRYYSSSGQNKVIDPEQDDRDRWYADFLALGAKYDLDVDRDEFAYDAWTVFVDARIEDREGRLLGVCGVGVRMTGSQNLFDELEREYGVKICLVDGSGLVQVDTDERNIETTSVQGVRLERGGDYVFQQLGRNRIVVTRYVDKLNWYLVVQSDGNREREKVINVILLNVGLYALVIVILTLAIRIILDRTKALTHASFRDQMTQLYNRRAFEEEKARLGLAMLPTDFVYVTADVNGLKQANDNLGHAAGDELIRGAARCLKSTFGKYGNVFRIGGDEFAAMLTLPEERVEPVMASLQEALAAWSGDQVRSLSVSCGYASSREFPSENLAELGRISDERMYAAKEEYYRTSGRERRQPR